MMPAITSSPRGNGRSTAREVLRRAASACLLVVQALVVGALPVADARAGHDAPIAAHWEDSSDTSCPPSHDLSACQLCQLIRAVASPATAGGELVAITERSRVAPTEPVASSARARLPGSASPRGPPATA